MDAGPRRRARERSPERLRRRLDGLRARLLEVEGRVALDRFGPRREDARNLLHYLALRQEDLGDLQDGLADLGLSSLGRAEGHVLYNLDATLAGLDALAGGPAPARTPAPVSDPETGRRRLARNASRMFGAAPAGRETRIMVTMPSEAASDPRLVRDLLALGMDCLRINCAHDGAAAWTGMIRNLRRAERETGRRCRVEMDLGGPHVRTTGLPPGPAVVKLRPTRDPFGRPTRPATVRLVAAGAPPAAGRPAADAELPVPPTWLARRRRGERVPFEDARRASRELKVLSTGPSAALASVAKTAYLRNGTVLAARGPAGRPDPCRIDGIPGRPGRLRLAVGDALTLRRPEAEGRRPSARSIGVSLPVVLDRVRPGHRVWFDGGRLGGVVRTVTRDGATLRIDHAPPGGAWLRDDQGINLPETELGLPPLTAEDRQDLAFVVAHADLVGYSFVQGPDDVGVLRDELRRLGRPSMGVVLKIETRSGFDQLPAILLAALGSGPTAVMLARGDLAVEIGFERLAEVQEEILWLSEAAHLPAIWATQVLEGLAKSGMPSRAEVTDAAMGERAECVMLNKGPYLRDAVRALDSILRRMQAHQAKKSARLRHLAVAERFLAATAPSGAAVAP